MLVLCAVLLGSCRGGPSQPRATDEARPARTQPGGPQVEINHPDDGSRLRSDDVLVTLTVRSFEIAERGSEPKDGRGHVIFYLDADPPTDEGRSALRSRASSRRVRGTSFTWKDVEPGRHRLAVQLVRSDDTPLDPPAIDRVAVRVARGPSD